MLFFELEALRLINDSMLGTGGGSLSLGGGSLSLGSGSLSLGGTGGRSLEVRESFLQILESVAEWSPLLLLFVLDSTRVSLILTLFTWFELSSNSC